MMENVGIQSMGAIVVLCYLLGVGVKASGLDNKWIPVIAGFFGGCLGLLGLWLGVSDLGGGGRHVRPDRRGHQSGIQADEAVSGGGGRCPRPPLRKRNEEGAGWSGPW